MKNAESAQFTLSGLYNGSKFCHLTLYLCTVGISVRVLNCWNSGDKSSFVSDAVQCRVKNKFVVEVEKVVEACCEMDPLTLKNMTT